MRITFWGAAETVTGSRFLIDVSGHRMLVDCGLFQGVKSLRQRNWAPFPVDPSTIDAVVVTHAHIDHTGYLPALVRDGFDGDIWSTEATQAMSRLLLTDAAHLQEEDARRANERRSSRHRPALPLYTTEDALRAVGRFRAAPFLAPFEPVPGVEVTFSPVGHILGAASIHLQRGDTSVFFTGDVGRPNDAVMRPPAPVLAASHVVTESTYGNRQHPDVDPLDELATIVVSTMERGGTLLIPVFAVGRAQTLLYLLSRLRAAGRIPEIPTYLNSPMAEDATELFCRHPDEHRLTADECRAMCSGVNFVRSVEESMDLTSRGGPMIVLSASGMLSGGRVLHHLETVAPDPRSTILLVGYQAAGTRGEALAAHARTVKLFGTYVPVRATVARMDSLSAHADARELTAWLASSPATPTSVHVVHGEPAAADAFRRTVRDELGWDATVAVHGATVELGATKL